MVEQLSSELDAVFHALAHPARRDILRRVAQSPQSITALAAPFDMSLEAVSKHVQVLERARLISRTRDGRRHNCALRPEALAGAVALIRELETMWSGRLDRLEGVLAALCEEEG